MSQTLDRSLRIMEFLANGPKRVSDVASELGVHHSTALRLMQTLRSRRFIYREEDGTYRLGPAVLALAQRALDGFDVRKIAIAEMRTLNELTRETIHLAVLVEKDVVYIEKIERRHPMRMFSRIGYVAPPHCTGVGKAILAYLPDEYRTNILSRTSLEPYTDNTITDKQELLEHLHIIRELGYATDEEEHEVGIRCIAAPVRDSGGVVRASVSVASPTATMKREELLEFAPDLIHAADAISYGLGWSLALDGDAPLDHA